MRKSRSLLALLGGAVAFAGAIGSAASLGGLNADALGSDDAVAASCDTDGIDLAYTTAWDATDSRYEVTEVVLSDIDSACVGQDLSVTLSDGTASLAEASQIVASGTETVTIAPGLGPGLCAAPPR